MTALKPPLGLMPRWRWLELRQQEIIEAMARCIAAEKRIPKEWIEELDLIATDLEDCRPLGG